MKKSIKKLEALKEQVLNIDDARFTSLALEVFRFQAKYNLIYREWMSYLRVNPNTIEHISEIPFMPIQFFKKHAIKSGDWQAIKVFESSSTTGNVISKHYIQDLHFYKKIAKAGFEAQFGACSNWVILALLPTYLERENSSLVYMVADLIKYTQSQHSGFYLNEYDKLKAALLKAKYSNKKVMLWGVTFALLDILEHNFDLSESITVETGGMKGRKKEITRQEVHELLKQKGNAGKICSEYGMTELLSQAYLTKGESFKPIPSLKVWIRDATDPFEKSKKGGGINVIDLANVHSCSFIETMDLGRSNSDRFEVLGRLDNSDKRGCSLM